MKIWIDGQLLDKSDAKISVFDHAVLYGDGVFEGIRIYDGQIFQCQAHLDRLFLSAQKIRLSLPYTKAQLNDAMKECIRVNGLQEGYIRLLVTRGVGNLGLNPCSCAKPCVIVIADTISLYPKELYENGMPVIIAKTLRTSVTMLDPSIKSLNYLNNIMAKIECLEAGVNEAIMLNARGEIAEATGDNVFIVKDGVLLTPPPDAGILLGVTRGVVLRLAKANDVRHAEQAIKPDDLWHSQECFLTGSAAEIIPVTRVNGRSIGDGKVGPVTRKLFKAFHEFIHTKAPQYDVTE